MIENRMMTGNRVDCLYRVSTDKQVDYNDKSQADIPMQRRECHRFCEKMGWTIVHEEQEDGVSAALSRPERQVPPPLYRARQACSTRRLKGPAEPARAPAPFPLPSRRAAR